VADGNLILLIQLIVREISDLHSPEGKIRAKLDSREPAAKVCLFSMTTPKGCKNHRFGMALYGLWMYT
jgi:hypothetical protein